MQKLGFRLQLQKDSFINTKSRKSATRNTLSVVICITLAIIVALLIVFALGNDPLAIFKDLFTKGFIDYKTLIWNIAILGIGGLSFSFAFKAGVFNIGIPGQMMFSGLMVLIISKSINDTGVVLPTGLGPILMLIIAIAFGAIIATITSLLKVYLNVNDVVSAILLNWIILFSVRLIVYKFYNPDPNQVFSQSIDIPSQFQLVAPNIGGWLPTLIIFIVLILGIFAICKYTTYGHKVIAVGANSDASAFAGYNVRAIKISTMAISGGLAGVMAMVLYTAGQSPSIPLTFEYDALPTQGLNGIAIGLIAMNNPLAIAPVAFIMGLFTSSSVFLQISPAFSQLIMGLIILGAAMFVILINYHPWLWIKKVIYGSQVITQYKNYENEMEILISKYRLQLSEIKNQEEINNLYKQYLDDKQAIKTQYLKQIFVLKVTNTFNPSVEAKRTSDLKNNVLEQQFIRYENRINKKLQKIVNKKDHCFNKLITLHQSLVKEINHSYKLANLPTKLSLQELLIYFSKKANHINQFMSNTITQSIECNNDIPHLNEKLLEYKNLLNNQLTVDILHSSVDLLNKKIVKYREVLEIIRKYFFFLSIKEKLLLFIKWYKYIKCDSSNLNWSISAFKQLLKDESVISNQDHLQLQLQKFDNKCLKTVAQWNDWEQKIKLKITSNENKITKNKEQLENWKKSNEIKQNKYFSWRAKLFGSLDSKYEHYCKQLNNLDLNEKEKQEMQSWLSDLYRQGEN